jgi:hydroxymethylpyrimidine pyrophosphatase-like HAD family hydrolase
MVDIYLKEGENLNRLWREYKEHGSITVAFDFDDTVYDFHKKGREYPYVIFLLQELKKAECYLICWTGNTDTEFVKKYLIENEIPFDSINENPPFYSSDSRKIYANAYLDDRAGLRQVYQELKNLLKIIKSYKNV